MTDKNKEPVVEKEKKKLCPFNPDPNFSCEDCRLFIHFTDGKEERVCAFIRVADLSEGELKMTDKKNDNRTIEADDGNIFTVKELKRFIRKSDITPSDLFDDYSLQEDPEIKKLISERADYEMESRDKKSEKEVKKMLEEDKKTENELNVDLLPEGDAPPSGPEKKREKKGESEEDKEGDLLPPGGESSESTEDDQEDEGELLPG